MITNNKIQNGTKIGTAVVYSNDFLGRGKVWTGTTNSLKFITIHNTGVVNVITGKNFHGAQRSNNLGKDRDASWHLTVGVKDVYQHNPLHWRAWHCGEKTGNDTSIGIEVCMSSDAKTQKEIYENAARLTVELMKTYKIPLQNVVQHNKWSGKNCPQFLRENKYGYNWTWFINLVKSYYNGNIVNEPSMKKPSTTVTGKITVITDTLNVRKGDSTNYSVVKTIKKNEVHNVYGKSNNGWYALADGQWISGDSSYVKFEEVKKGFEVGSYQKDVIVTADPTLSVRSGRGTSYGKLGSFAKGTKVNVWYIGKASDNSLWGSCDYKGKTGFIHMGYVKEI
ncbi:MAG: N-acetylmuramoyl-L-alanine amidase [Bacilli bacterium]|uniref:N-acetylmuramoyl-L-alanine amidase n=1 Tax=Clostridium sp. TaxID=1506 RepID=UPI002FCAEA11